MRIVLMVLVILAGAIWHASKEKRKQKEKEFNQENNLYSKSEVENLEKRKTTENDSFPDDSLESRISGLKILGIVVQRDSVCMADDIEDHQDIVKISETATLGEFLSLIKNINYLALISGGKATWVVKCFDSLLAVVAQEWQEPQYIQSQDTKVLDIIKGHVEPIISFEYLAQINPDMTYRALNDSVENKIKIIGSLRDFVQR